MKASILVASACAALALTQAAHAGVRVGAPVDISGASPFSADCQPQAAAYGPSASAMYPFVATDPRQPDRLAAVFSQGPLANRVAVSRDGGSTWNPPTTLPGTDACHGGPDGSIAFQPQVTFGPEGTIYAISMSGTSPPLPAKRTAKVLLHRSTDDGRTWEGPFTVSPSDGAMHYSSAIAADPNRPGRLYAAWTRVHGLLDHNGDFLFARSDDGGQTWSSARTLHKAAEGDMAVIGGIPVLDDGTIVLPVSIWRTETVLPHYPASLSPTKIVAMRSTDGGTTWDSPRLVGSGINHPTANPEDPDKKMQTEQTAVGAAAADGTVYFAWHDEENGVGRIRLVRSTDGGATWSSPRSVAAAPGGQLFVPAIATNRRGTVGVGFYSDASDTDGDGEWTVDVQLAHSRDRGQTWDQTRLTAPFDAASADYVDRPFIAGYRLGWYQGLTATRRGFTATFAVAKPLATHSQQSVFAFPAAVTP